IPTITYSSTCKPRRSSAGLSRRSDPMLEAPLLHPDLEKGFYQLYRDFFDKAEKKRRWSLRDDIPWNDVNPGLNPVLADVVESFCAVELYLPDYVAAAMSMFRASRGWTWFYANWGYEESKHSLA